MTSWRWHNKNKSPQVVQLEHTSSSPEQLRCSHASYFLFFIFIFYFYFYFYYYFLLSFFSIFFIFNFIIICILILIFIFITCLFFSSCCPFLSVGPTFLFVVNTGSSVSIYDFHGSENMNNDWNILIQDPTSIWLKSVSNEFVVG